MDKLQIDGGRRLEGTIAIAGAKNAALPQIAASLLSPYTLTLTNLPQVGDVANMLGVVGRHGVGVNVAGPHTATLDAGPANHVEAPYDVVRKMRATVLVLGPLVARFGRARVSLPGGCAIGARPIDLHMKVLAQLGTSVAIESGYIVAEAPSGLAGARIVLASPSVGATQTAMMAATYATGETEIVNAAGEPEVADLAACLVAMGANIEGAGTHRIAVQGPTNWRAARHHTIPDRIEAGTYAMAAAITRGHLELTGARLEHLGALAQMLETVGARMWPTDRGLMVACDRRVTAADISTEPYPGFPTDLQAQYMALMAVADGACAVRETIFENRFMHVPELVRMGADISLRGSTALVRGRSTLVGAPVMATDLRASVCLVLAGLVAEGQTTVSRVYHLDRGYEDLARKLVRCGAAIRRVPE
ncbi:MAG: UDP-N-acetylglucosamine 1-carboxyvinyltransferase [Rhodospirillales bacterium]|jgi:UDP-N-acetylglucosamine 1-carboxyvinyltransferase